MTQNRRPPAYQEYAAEMLANMHYRTLSLFERGLLYTIRLECWVNNALPSEPQALAKVLGLSADEVVRALPKLGHFIQKQDNKLVCPELENYRAHLEDRKRKQSEGGRKGAKMTNGRLSKIQNSTRRKAVGTSEAINDDAQHNTRRQQGYQVPSNHKNTIQNSSNQFQDPEYINSLDEF